MTEHNKQQFHKSAFCIGRFMLLVFAAACALTAAFVTPIDASAQSTFAPAPANPTPGQAALQIPFVDLSVRPPRSGSEVAVSLQLLLLLTVLTLSPAILVLMTSFLRITIVLSFVQQALGLQQIPPRQVVVGIAVFLSIFIMWPVFQKVNTNAVQPLTAGTITTQEAFTQFMLPFREFMYRQMQEDPKNIQLFMRMSQLPAPATLADVPSYVLIPAFVLYELTIAFKMGILLFIPFVIIDIVVASVTMSMGMIMLPPVMISLPLKLVLFILVDGWGLLVQQLILSFGGR